MFAGSEVGTSMATIRAQVKREMEAVKKVQEKERAQAEVYSPPTEVVKDAAPVLAVSGVLFNCPLVGPEVLPKAEMEARIHEFLLSQLPEEPQMTSALMIHTLNKDKTQVKACMDILCKYLDNIASHPEEEKYRRIRLNNKVFQEKVSGLDGTQEFLQAAGFERCMLPGPNEVEEEFYVMNEESAKDGERLKELKEILVNAEPIRPELDPNLKVFYPSARAMRMEVPDEFYAISPEELKREQQRRQEAVERLGMLRTKEMREREQMRELRKYRYTLIRVRFPDGVILQGTFRALEKLPKVMEFIRECLENSWMPFFINTQTGHRLTDEESTLTELGLAPAAIVNFAWDPAIQQDIAAQKGSIEDMVYLNEATMAQIQNLS